MLYSQMKLIYYRKTMMEASRSADASQRVGFGVSRQDMQSEVRSGVTARKRKACKASG